ncbi:hypothetical protein CYMTET_8930, partial [Cymbomonas tetramitiformis]
QADVDWEVQSKWRRFRVTIDLGEGQLQMEEEFLTQTGVRNEGLALLRFEEGRLQLSRLFSPHLLINFTMESGKLFDCRPSSPFPQNAAVLRGRPSTKELEHCPTPLFLCLEYKRSLSEVNWDIVLQCPALEVDVRFVVAVCRFFVPTFANGAAEAAAHLLPSDVVFGEDGVHRATSDLTLSYTRRLLADTRLHSEYVYDGQGHVLQLPTLDLCPVILIGPNTHLRFRNVRLRCARSLHRYVELGAGASFSIDAEDGVSVKEGKLDSLRWSRAMENMTLHKNLEYCFPQHATLVQLPLPPPDRALILRLRIVGLDLGFPDTSSIPTWKKQLRAQLDLLLSYERSKEGVGVSLHASSFSLSALFDIAYKPKRQSVVAAGSAVVAGLSASSGAPAPATPSARLDRADSLEVPVSPGDVTHRSNSRNHFICPVLEPCDMHLNYNHTATVGCTGLMSASGLAVALSADLVELLANVVSQMSSALGSSAPTRSALRFERIWSSVERDGKGVWEKEGITFWRPCPPAGYVSLGDCVTRGLTPPSASTMVVRSLQALVMPPAEYTRVWAMPGVQVWLPVPPEGYVALGCLATRAGSKPPPQGIWCMRRELVRNASAVECMWYQEGSPEEEGAAGTSSVWQLDNLVNTFMAQPAAVPDVAHLLDLRQPLGMSTEVPVADRGLQHGGAPGKRVGTSPQAAKHQLQQLGVGTSPPGDVATPPSKTLSRTGEVRERAFSSHTSAPGVVEKLHAVRMLLTEDGAECVWSDRNTRQLAAGLLYTSGMSLWRPPVPYGYALLGDAAMRGYDPPSYVLAVRDVQDGALSLPRDFELIWHNGIGGQPGHCAFWRPMPTPGYVALGCVASRGVHKPPLDIVRCVRQDMV